MIGWTPHLRHLRRRTFITELGSATAWSVVARGQQAQSKKLPVIGFLHSQSPDRYGSMLAGLRQGLKEAGFVEGQNVEVRYRWANGHLDLLPSLASDLVRQRVAAIIVSGGSGPPLAAKATTSTIPIILAIGADPIELGLVDSLSRPGNNITGFSFNSTAGGTKRLQLLHDAVPQATTFGVLTDPVTREREKSELRDAALAGALQLLVKETRSDSDFDDALAGLVEHRVGGLLVVSAPMFTNNRTKLLALAAQHKMPAIYPLREYAADGGLMSYGASQASVWRQAAIYAGRILQGATPSELPIQLPTKFEFVLNAKTANALGLKLSPTLLALADEVIE